MLSPGRPLGDAPVPIEPGVDVFGTPGWLTLLPVVPVDGVEAVAGGVAGETPVGPAAEPGVDGGEACADAARVETVSAPAVISVKSSLWRISTSMK